MVEQQERRARGVEDRRDQGAEAGLGGQGGGARGVDDAAVFRLGEEAQGEGVLQEAEDDVLGEGGVLGYVGVGGAGGGGGGVERHGGPEVEVVQSVEGCCVGHDLSSNVSVL